MRRTTRITIEELYHENISAEAEVSVTFDLQPEEKPTRNYPGHPATVERIDWKIDSYTLFGAVAEVDGHAPTWLQSSVSQRLDDLEQELMEQVCEEASDAEQAAHEEYWDAKRDRMRTEGE